MPADDGKRVHWTQTPEGKKKMSLAQRKRWKQLRRAGRTKLGPRAKRQSEENGTHAEPSPRATRHVAHIAPDIVAYALGHIEGWLEHFARGAGVSESELAARVGAVLSRKVSR